MSGTVVAFRRRRSRPDAHAWAARIRVEMGWAGCGDPSHWISTPFRRANKWPPVDECKLRGLARRQLAEMRAGET